MGIGLTSTMLMAANPPASRPLSFQRDVLPILQTNCAVCHQNLGPMGGLTLEPDEAYENLVDMPSMEIEMQRVEPGDPERSYLIRKVEGTHAGVGGKGLTMPIGGVLAPADVQTLRRWVSEGAKNN
ncbi:hypothetical protein [Croceicoccus bisphenolivorans]|uniref:hypothetical protein n=1 Tax=Croceicoccus bisphenolivorans TaxID=1783232 RepID=UPI0012E94DCD|nr:hypothetical protein [Croceicoccus bisphenolivorans]